MQAPEKDQRVEKDRRDWIIVFVIILFGLLCILLAGGWALRLSPGWRLNSDMGSRLNPDSEYLTSRPKTLFEPIDSSILTKPVWALQGLYLTPGATFKTGTPFPTTISTALPPPATPTAILTTPTPGIIITPTKTSGSLPPVPPPARTSTASPVPVPTANLSITVADGSTTYVVGSTITYTITVINPAGSSTVNGATVTDNFPAALSAITWTCTGSGGATCTASGNSNINDTVNLPAGSSVIYTVNANISAAATGNLVNTALVTLPGGITDPSLANNTATDTDTPIFNVNLQISKTDGVTIYTPGTSVTYTIILTNMGPANVTGAIVADTFPSQISGVNWSCTAASGATCPAASGMGNINQTINIPVGGTLTYTALASIFPAANGTMINTATITAPGGYTETNPADNSSIDTDTVFIPTADISITKTDGATTYTPGNTLSYIITASNAGPDAATGITITDTFDTTRLSNIAWTCSASGGASCTASGTGNISDTVNLPSSGTVTYTVSAKARSNATGNLTNTAQAGIPANINDPVPGNNSYSDTDTPVFTADLQIQKTDNSTDYVAGATKSYIIVVSNAGPSDVTGANVADLTLTNATNPNISSATWTCSGTGTATCTAGPASGNINDSVNIPANSQITYIVTATVVASPSGDLVNTATVTAPGGVTDPVSNNLASDTDNLFTANSFPPVLGTGSTPTGPPYLGLTDGAMLILSLPTPLIVGSHAGYDLIYYEEASGTGIRMDWITLQISDGSNWYTILNWGDTLPDTNTNISVPLTGNSGGDCSGEMDNCQIDGSLLVNSTGVAIDVDGLSIPAGTYPYLRITVSMGVNGPSDGGVNIDGFYVVP